MKAITILNYAVGTVDTYELSEKTICIMEGDEIVEFFGNNPSDCHYMIHDLNDVNTHLLELPF